MIQKPEAKVPVPEGGPGAQGDRISVFGNALELLSGAAAPKEQPTATPAQSVPQRLQPTPIPAYQPAKRAPGVKQLNKPSVSQLRGYSDDVAKLMTAQLPQAQRGILKNPTNAMHQPSSPGRGQLLGQPIRTRAVQGFEVPRNAREAVPDEQSSNDEEAEEAKRNAALQHQLKSMQNQLTSSPGRGNYQDQVQDQLK